MPIALEAVDLAALLAEAVAWALLTVLVILLAKLVSVMHFTIDLKIVSFEPLGWLADALSSYVLTGAEDARRAVQGAMKATYDGLVWSFDEMLSIFTDLATATKGAFSYLWHTALGAFVSHVVNPIRALATKAESEVVALTRTVALNLAKAESYAEGVGWKRLGDAEAFTRREVSAARADATAASAFIQARLDGIGAQATTVAEDVLRAPGIVWDDLKQHVDPKNLADATILGVLGALGIHALTDATGLDKGTCQANQRALCGADPAKWLKLLEGLAALGLAFDFAEFVTAAESIVGDAESLLSHLA